MTDEVVKISINLERINEIGKLLLKLEKSIEVGEFNFISGKVYDHENYTVMTKSVRSITDRNLRLRI